MPCLLVWYLQYAHEISWFGKSIYWLYCVAIFIERVKLYLNPRTFHVPHCESLSFWVLALNRQNWGTAYEAASHHLCKYIRILCLCIFEKYHGIAALLEIMNVNYFIYKNVIYYLVYFPIAYFKVENINKHQGI